MQEIGIEQFLQQIGLYSGVVIAFVQVLKWSLGDYINNKFYPLISLVVGFLFGFFLIGWPVLLSIMIGLVASGAYDLGTKTYKGIVE